jgi:microcystin-dependent protein
MPVISSPFGSDAPTPRLGLPGPVLTDPADVPLDVKALRDALDPVTVVFLQGLAGAMPAAGTSGRYYWATDTKVLYYDDGTTWYQPGSTPAGGLMPTASQLAPQGWLLCNGAQYSRSTYAVLWNAIGLSWTATDDGATFNVPDLRSRMPVGAGQGAGLTNRSVGQRGGEEVHALSPGEMPVHAHGVNDPTHAHGVYDPGHSHPMPYPFWVNGEYMQGSMTVGSGTAVRIYIINGPNTNASGTGVQIYGSGTGISIGNAGGGAAHNNLPPWAAVNWLIKT